MPQSNLITVTKRRDRWARLLNELVDAFDTSTGHSHNGTDSRSISASVTLDQAYDSGGSGAGRAVTVDSGAVTLTNNAANNNNVLEITKNPAGAQSGAGVSVTMGAQASGAGISFANTGSGADLLGSGSTWSVSAAGAALFASVDLNGAANALILDADANTHISAPTDDQVDFATGGVDVFRLTATQAQVLAGATAGLSVAAGGVSVTAGGVTVAAGGATITGTTAITGATTVTGTLHVTSTLTVDGVMTFAGQVTMSNGLDMNGTELILDVDADTSITADTDDRIDLRVSGNDVVVISATQVDINALELVLDADADTSITADTDDQIDVRVSGADDFQITANTFTVLSGSALSVASGATMSLTGTTTVADDSLLTLGAGSIARLSYDTTDGNANLLMLQLPAGGATDVPVVAIGEAIESVDFGAVGVTFNGVVNPTIGVFSTGAVATSSAIRFYKSRGTVAAPTVVTTGDDLASFDFYGAVANNEYVQAARIYVEMAGTIATTRGPGVIYFQTATDAAPSVLTTAMTISAAQLVTVAAGLTATTGNVTVTSGNLSFGAASDIAMPAATAAALEISDGTIKFYAFDTRVDTVGVTTHALDISEYTLASAANAVATGLSLAAHTLNYTGGTQVTTQVDTVVIGARTLVGGVAITVDEANSVLLVAPTEGANVTLTAAAALRVVNAGGTPANQYGVYIEDLTVGDTTDVGIYIAGADSAAIYVAADPIHVADSVIVGFGSGTGVGAYDASISYNGTNLVIDPDVIGTGEVVIGAGLQIAAGETIRSNGVAEIGISVTNAALVVGTSGSLVAPYLASAATAFTDAIGGDNNGCIGINYDTGGAVHTLEARSNGAWVSIALAGVEIQGETSGGKIGWWHPNQILDAKNYRVDETICVVCGDKMAVGDAISLYANFERGKNLHAVYGHAHPERDAYIQGLEARIKELEAKLAA